MQSMSDQIFPCGSRRSRGVLIYATFRQLRNGRFSPNLVTKRTSVSRRGMRKDVFVNFHICPQNLKSKVGQTGPSLRAERNALQWDTVTPRCRPRDRELLRSGQLFSTTYGCGATGRQNCPIFGFWPVFPIQNPENVLPVTSLQPRGYIAEWLRFSLW